MTDDREHLLCANSSFSLMKCLFKSFDLFFNCLRLTVVKAIHPLEIFVEL